MYNKKKLRIAMIEKDYTVAKLAEAIGVSESALYRKIRGDSEFTLSEMLAICRVLDTKGKGIFFDSELA